MTRRDLFCVIAGVVLLLVLQAIDAASLVRSTASRLSTDALVFQPMSGAPHSLPRSSVSPVRSVSEHADTGSGAPFPAAVSPVALPAVASGTTPQELRPSSSPVSRQRPSETTPAPTASPRGTVLRGTASWFDAPTGTAAAGPSLRAFLGSSWRGQRVTVTAGGHAVRVKLTDFCGWVGYCSRPHAHRGHHGGMRAFVGTDAREATA